LKKRRLSIKLAKKESNHPVEKKKTFINILLSFIFLAFFLLPAFASIPAAHATDIEARVASFKIYESSQVLLVTNNCPLFFAVKIYALEKQGGKWKIVLESFNGVIGKNGFAKPEEKREGDGKTPSGIFALNMTFGYNESIQTKMPYRQSLTNDLWIDDVNAGDYNRWVKKEDTRALSYEKMKRDDNLYKYGIIIEYNTSPVIKGHGSAIFLHVWRGDNTATAGCVAVSEEDIIRILDWLDPKAKPLIIMGTDNIMKRFIQ
jgi:L,D-peptidoglycan transpeptidase YkuD (ErfK/YbiS/YcfS/YnhG family)